MTDPVMSVEELALEFVQQTVYPDGIPTCWSHIPSRVQSQPCRKVECLYESCGCITTLIGHTSKCNNSRNLCHAFKDDETRASRVELLMISISNAKCVRCADIQVEIPVETKPKGPSFLEKWVAKKAGRKPVTKIWNRQTVTKFIPNPNRVATAPAELILCRKLIFEARILNQRVERKAKQERFLRFRELERERDPLVVLYRPTYLFEEFPSMKKLIEFLVLGGGPGGARSSGGLDPCAKF
ncbi:hypothetical protein VTL71DRAFT_2829 [Oculimacula yallundae]|uniref:Uncharacterized protein n=1 Tax=Oculimacula yallundae TaxID=86028 RepID=A0ABR4C9Y7_9HELO